MRSFIQGIQDRNMHVQTCTCVWNYIQEHTQAPANLVKQPENLCRQETASSMLHQELATHHIATSINSHTNYLEIGFTKMTVLTSENANLVVQNTKLMMLKK